ncbi:ion transporter [Psychrobacter sp. FDAARGOS_221]|uniref:ion transporter n=1 Tax=Psychrobacter sp. FDAARGOS_221 TaxID=1975705 RepID=UPI000BB55E81|nr:ion transporter [Psychrobacter sp. FDAARGOS_221]PNK59724.1 ion transporter [Psychrobacter sp. FDAARGOS_221]
MIRNQLYQQLRSKTFDIIENDKYQTPLSKFVDKFLIILILLNVSAVIAESVDRLYFPNQHLFNAFENFSIIIFTAEYLLRVWAIVERDKFINPDMPNWKRRWNWIKSPGAIIDIISILPAFMNYFVTVDLRFLRVLRLFRLLKLTRYFAAMRILLIVLHKEKESFKAVVFILVIMIVTAASGIYVVENQAQPEVFESIPKSMWWAVVTLTTVGYGDVIPVTNLGKFLGAVMTILGVGLAALPAGILASGLASELEQRRELLEQRFRELLLEDEHIDLLKDKYKVDKIRRELGLNKEQAQEVILQLLREHEYEQKLSELDKKNFCPHCGEHL